MSAKRRVGRMPPVVGASIPYMLELGVSDARERLAELIDRTRVSGEPIYVTRRGRRVAVILGTEQYDSLVEAVEEVLDRSELAQTRAEDHYLPWEKGTVEGEQASRYRIEGSRRAIRSMRRLDRRDHQRVRAALGELAGDPRPPGCRALAGEERAYRLRVGDHRIIYEALDDRLVIQVVRACLPLRHPAGEESRTDPKPAHSASVPESACRAQPAAWEVNKDGGHDLGRTVHGR